MSLLDKVDFLFVSCCVEQTRFELQKEVLSNLSENIDKDILKRFTCIDNGSTIEGTVDSLKSVFDRVVQFDKNYGFWSAIQWWLDKIEKSNSTYCYIVESDNFHYDFYKLERAVEFLETHPEIGSVRCQEYSVVHKELYDKYRQRPDSKKHAWQTHINRASGEQVSSDYVDGLIYTTNFLTQLPALNRKKTMINCFDKLRKQTSVDEFDFQKLYYGFYPKISLIEGGIYSCPKNLDGITMNGSWEDPKKLNQLGYRTTRIDRIEEIKGFQIK